MQESEQLYSNTQDSLMELYKQHQNEVTGNTEIKALFTERKLQLNQAV